MGDESETGSASFYGPVLTAAVLALAAICPVAIAGITKPIRANLDADRGIERIVPRRAGKRFVILVEDRCQGRKRSYRVSSPSDSVDVLRALNVDGVRSQDAFFVLRNRGTNRPGGGRIVRLATEFLGECPRPRLMFSYTTARPPIRPPSGSKIASFSIWVGNFSRRYPGLEVQVGELYVSRRRGRATSRRVTLSRWAPARQAFVRYQSIVRKLR